MKYVYPAIFTPENDYFLVKFPDIDGCFTDGKDLPEAIEMAKDVLNLMLCHLEDRNNSVIPAPSPIKEVSVENNEFVSLIEADTAEYRKFYDRKAVKKTLSIPAWLNNKAEQQHINFSQTLQDALRTQLGL